MEAKRTIKEILDLESGQIIQTADYFKKPFQELTRIRSEMERANQNFRDKFIVCAVCGENLRLLGGTNRQIINKSRNFHFAHLHNSKECPIKTTSRYSKEDINRMKYRGATESILHRDLKAMISQGLYLNQSTKGQVSDIRIEQVVRSLDEQEWKKPDISIRFREDRIAIELQLSTTWLDVITSRQEFYRAQKMYILWIFHAFERSDDFRKLTYSDIIYTNNNNAYVFSKPQSEKTVAVKDLVLTCHYLEYYADEQKVRSTWKTADVTLDMLTYRPAKGQLFYFDSLGSKVIAERQAEDYEKKQQELERAQERERWRRISEKRELTESLKEALESQKLLEQTLSSVRSSLDSAQLKMDAAKERIPGLEEEIRTLFLRLENAYLYGLPSPVVDIVEILKKEFLEIIGRIKSINEVKKDLVLREKNISQLPDQKVNGILYKRLDKIRDWNFIEANFKTLFCFRNDQPDDLWNTPKVQGIVPHQLSQLQFNNKVSILVDFNERLKEVHLSLSATADKLSVEQERLNTFQAEFCSKVHQKFLSSYDEQIKQMEEDIRNDQSSLKETEVLLLNLNKEIKIIRKNLDEYYYDEDDAEW